MERLLLGLIALPVAALLYVLAQWLGPRILEPVPEPAAAAPAAHGPRPARRLDRKRLIALRASAAVLVLALTAFGVSRWPSSQPGAGQVPRAAEVQLPPPSPLKVQARTGSEGSAQDQLKDPRDVAVDAAGNLYVADTSNKRIVKLTPDGRFIAAWSSSSKGPLLEPSALTVISDGLVVDDSEAAQLLKFTFGGQPVPGFDHDLALSHPRGIAASPDGTIFAADTANNRVLRVGPDGAPRGPFDTKGVKLDQPTGVAFDEQGSVYVLEPAASRIQKFTPDGTLQAHLFMPASVTVLPPRGTWFPGRGLTVTLPEQNELLSYGAETVPQATFIPEGPPVLRPLGIAVAADKQSVWVVWNGSASLTQLLWP